MWGYPFLSGLLPAGSSLVSLLPSGNYAHKSDNLAHPAILVGKVWFLGKSRSNPFYMGDGYRFCLAWLNVEFRKKVSTLQLLSADGAFEPKG